MRHNPLSPQATTTFNARLDKIISMAEKDVLVIKQNFNARGVLYSSEAVQKIYQRIDEAITETGRAASESAQLAYEAGHHSYSQNLESDMLDTFESNFSSGYQRLCAVRINLSQPICDGLSNKKVLENDEHLKIIQHAKIQGQLMLRRYFQALKRARKRWYEYIPFFTRFVIWLFKPH